MSEQNPLQLTTADLPNLPPSVLKKMNAEGGQRPDFDIVTRCFFIKDGEEPDPKIRELRSNPDRFIVTKVAEQRDHERGGYSLFMEYYEIVGWHKIELPPIIDGDVQMGGPPQAAGDVPPVTVVQPPSKSAVSGVVTFVPPEGVEQPAVSPVAPKPPEF